MLLLKQSNSLVMPEKPILLFPRPTVATRSRLRGGADDVRLPTPSRQRARLEPQFEQLKRLFRPGGVTLQEDAGTAAPEQVLVLETIGTVADFVRAVEQVDGLEWLLECIQENIDPDADFFIEGKEGKKLSGMLYLIGANQTGFDQMLSLWERYKEDPEQPFPRGLTRFRDVFSALKDVRRWDYRDRLRETYLLENWRFRLETARNQPVRFEAELWYRTRQEDRDAAVERFSLLLSEAEGRIISQAIIPEIRYHGVLGELPAHHAENIIRRVQSGEVPEVQVIHAEGVMFFRPVGQVVADPVESDPIVDPNIRENDKVPEDPPIIALLDGFPLENHFVLRNRLIIDDPEGLDDSYPPSSRQHGTAMASLLIHGDLHADEPPLRRRVYVRPILIPHPHFSDEILPEDQLTVDLVHRAVRRMLEGEGGAAAVAPTIKVINFSIGDPSRPLDSYPSPLARLLDWLSWKYGVLFVISAGNHPLDIALTLTREQFQALSADELQLEVLREIRGRTRECRLLSPAESVNGLTVAAAHTDGSEVQPSGTRRDLLRSPFLPSPISAQGLGFQRSIKPDILMPGGRQVFNELPTLVDGKLTFRIDRGRVYPPGQKVASPGTGTGDLRSVAYICGTSNAAALATRASERVYDLIQDLRRGPEGNTIPEDCIGVLIKAFLAHGATWDGILEVLGQVVPRQTLKDDIARLVGYGLVDIDRACECTDQRAILVGCGAIGDNTAHEYRLPLPPSLSGQAVRKRLTYTLAYFSPVNCAHSRYRRAALWCAPGGEGLDVDRQNGHGQSVTRGTLQHEVLDGERADVFEDGDSFTLKVNCRALGGRLDEEVKYALIASLEVAPETGIPVYSEIQARVMPAVRARTRA